MRKKHGSFLSSSLGGSGHNVNSTATTSSNIQLLHVKASSENTTPEHSITEAVVHSSVVHESDATPKVELSNQEEKQDESTFSDMHEAKDDNDEKDMMENKQIKRLHSEMHHKDASATLEKTTSLPNLADNQKEAEDDEVKVDVGYMYDLAFQRQNSSK